VPVGILTNDMQAFHGPEWKHGISMLRRVTTIVDGSITGYLKPDPRSYQAGLAAMDCGPDEVVFVDDLAVNCRGAEALGISTVLFDVTDPAASIAETRRRLSER
jgi:putative hydrolase of the HAD superfamily